MENKTILDFGIGALKKNEPLSHLINFLLKVIKQADMSPTKPILRSKRQWIQEALNQPLEVD